MPFTVSGWPRSLRKMWGCAGRPFSQPGRQHGIGIGRQQHQPLLLALAQHAQPGRLGSRRRCQQIVEPQTDQLAHAQPGAPQQDEPGAVTGAGDDGPDLRHRIVLEVAWQSPRLLTGMALEAHRVGPTQVARLLGQEVEEDLQGSHPALDRGGAQPGLSLLIDKGIDILHRDLAPGFADHRRELAHIADVEDRRAAAGARRSKYCANCSSRSGSSMS